MTYKANRFIGIFIIISMALFWPVLAMGVELTIPAIKVLSGERVNVPIHIDQVDNLAGVKLVLTYDPNLLAFKKGIRTDSTSSLMHIVNDKRPGLLILVMAGAKGIQGKEIPIFSFVFETAKDLKTERQSAIAIGECQLMNDQLENLPCGTQSFPITISPALKK